MSYFGFLLVTGHDVSQDFKPFMSDLQQRLQKVSIVILGDNVSHARPTNLYRGDKVTVLTHTYPHKPLKKIKWPSAITMLTTHFMCGLMSDLVICKHRKENSHT